MEGEQDGKSGSRRKRRKVWERENEKENMVEEEKEGRRGIRGRAWGVRDTEER